MQPESQNEFSLRKTLLLRADLILWITKLLEQDGDFTERQNIDNLIRKW